MNINLTFYLNVLISNEKCIQILNWYHGSVTYTITKDNCAPPYWLYFLSVSHLLEVADPVQPPGSHVSSEAVGRLCREHSQRASV